MLCRYSEREQKFILLYSGHLSVLKGQTQQTFLKNTDLTSLQKHVPSVTECRLMGILYTNKPTRHFTKESWSEL